MIAQIAAAADNTPVLSKPPAALRQADSSLSQLATCCDENNRALRSAYRGPGPRFLCPVSVSQGEGPGPTARRSYGRMQTDRQGLASEGRGLPPAADPRCRRTSRRRRGGSRTRLRHTAGNRARSPVLGLPRRGRGRRSETQPSLGPTRRSSSRIQCNRAPSPFPQQHLSRFGFGVQGGYFQPPR